MVKVPAALQRPPLGAGENLGSPLEGLGLTPGLLVAHHYFHFTDEKTEVQRG